jgi:hypothetical protein
MLHAAICPYSISYNVDSCVGVCRKERCHLVGYQPIDPQVKSQYRDGRKDSGGPGPKVQQKSSTDQRIGRKSSNLLPETYDDAAAMGLTANGAGTISIQQFLFWPFIILKTASSYHTAVCRDAK